MTTTPAPAVFQSPAATAREDLEETHFRGLEDPGQPIDARSTKAAVKPEITLDIDAQRRAPRRTGLPVISPVWRSLRQLGYASIFYGLRLRGQFPSRLLASPSDMWPGDPAVGQRMQEGLFQHQGFETNGDIPDFTDPDLPPALQAWLHSFVWLRDLATLDDIRKARAIAVPALTEWMVHYARWDKTAWAPDVLGQRLISLINHAPLVLASKDLVYRSKVLNALAQQGRHLARTLTMAPPGIPRVKAATGLVFSSVLLPGGESRIKPGLKVLERELAQCLAPDGTPESRNPEDLAALLELLITLRDGYRAARKTAPTFVQVNIDKAAAALRGLCLSGHGFAALNGARHGQARRVQHCLDMSESQASPLLLARQGGYQRLEGGRSAVVVDTGLAPKGRLSRAAGAGALAFEFAHNGEALVVNCGAATPGADCGVPADALRATAAHSTMVINDTNMARLKASGEVGRTAKSLRSGRETNMHGQGLRVQSDTYLRRYDYVLERRVWLEANGLTLEGEDCARAPSGKAPRRKERQLDIRFHLHPHVDVTSTGDSNGALLRLQNGVWWRFRAEGGAVSIEPSVYVTLQNARAVPTQQIVISLPLEAPEHRVTWSFQHGQSAA